MGRTPFLRLRAIVAGLSISTLVSLVTAAVALAGGDNPHWP
jgi:hypothetical protein